MKPPKLLIIRGLPGSGKSTYAKKLAKQFNVAHYENDMYLINNGKYIWTPSAAKNAAKSCFMDVIAELKQGKDVIVSNVFVTRKVIDNYVNAAKRLGAEVMVLRMTNDFGNIHDVPEKTLLSMKSNFEDYPGEIIK